ncbi:hypothetical protein [Streptomyces lycii]|uniref:hypothetical protein n=1 Tax=Streptomyces lycii TaxID=2654337 RepID=UPI001F1E25A6|nr:hypothetical protein [Streptomyces lycii]
MHATVAEENTASLPLLERIGYDRVRGIREDDGSVTRLLTCGAGRAREAADGAPEF